jgi:lambda family phage portal protein
MQQQKPVRRLKALTGGMPARRGEAHFGASAAREFHSWSPSQGSADSDLLPELGTLRSRTRDLERNHGIAAGAVQTQVDHILGVGARLSCKPIYRSLGWAKEQSEEWSRDVEAKWRGWAETPACDVSAQQTFRGLSTQMLRGVLLNGEALALAMWMPGRVDTEFATCLQLIEADRLSTPLAQLDTDTLRGGIEYDGYGKPIAYHIRRAHPGEAFAFAGAEKAYAWERVEAATYWGRARVIHVHAKERTGQSRGKPMLSAVIGQFKMLDHFQRTTLQAAVVNAMVAAFVETPLPPEAMAEAFGTDLDDDKIRAYMTAQREMMAPLKGAAVLSLPPGSKLSPFIPGQPTDTFAPFVEAVVRHIGVGLNMPYELILKDFSKTNYSSARASLLEAYRFFAGRRAWLVDTWLRPVYRLWLEEAVNSQAVPIQADGFYRQRFAYEGHRWIWPGRGWVDPVKEAEAAVIRMDNKLSTLEDECAEQGKDWEEVLEQRATELARIRALGLPEAEPVKRGTPQVQVQEAVTQ